MYWRASALRLTHLKPIHNLIFYLHPASQAALEAVWHVPCGGITYGDENLCFIANDWHTALLPVYLQVRE
jgi:hypothetical protein